MTLLPSLLGAADLIRAHPHAVGGYARTVNQESRRRLSGGNIARERVNPGAFARAIDAGGWRLLRDHIEGTEQASTDARTLHVEEDEYGLWFEASLPDDAAGAQLMDRVRRRDVCEVSIGWQRGSGAMVDGVQIWRHLEEIEISLVTPPKRAAYASTFVLPNLAARRHRLRVGGM